MIEVFKLTTGLYDQSLPPLFSTSTDSITRGHSKKLYQQRANKNIRKNFFTYRVIQTWNNLPEEVINAKTVKSFERRLDKHWEKQELMYNYESNLTTGCDIITSDDDLDLSIVVF